MKRPIALSVAVMFLAGCSGMGGADNRLLPTAPSRVSTATPFEGVATRSGAVTTVALKLFPGAIAREARSIGIAVNGGAAKIFNSLPTSPDCRASAAGIACTFLVRARAGIETFEVSAYRLENGRGSLLARGSAVFLVAKNSEFRLGPAVKTADDRGRGSLRSAIGDATPGETIVFFVPKHSRIVLDDGLSLAANVTIAGPGRDGVTLSGNDEHQIFAIPKGVTATISGLTLTHGNATRAAGDQSGGAIANHGTLTLVENVLTHSTSNVGSPMRNRAIRQTWMLETAIDCTGNAAAIQQAKPPSCYMADQARGVTSGCGDSSTLKGIGPSCSTSAAAAEADRSRAIRTPTCVRTRRTISSKTLRNYARI